MKPIDRLRRANPVPSNDPVRRPTLSSIIPGVAFNHQGLRQSTRPSRRRAWVALGVAGGLAVAGVSAMVLPQVLTHPAPMADSAYYETFDQLAAASSTIVYVTVTGKERTVVDGIDTIVYTLDVHTATVGDADSLEVLIPASADGIESTAETEGLEVGREYVLALTELGERWHLTSPAGQSAFLVSDGAVGRSLDGSLTIDIATTDLLGF